MYLSGTEDISPQDAHRASIAVFIHNRLKTGWSEAAARKALTTASTSPCRDNPCSVADIDAAMLLLPDLKEQQKKIDGPKKKFALTFNSVLLIAGVGALALLVLVPAPPRRRRRR